MSEHIIRQNKDRANPLREPKVNEVYLYTISSRQDYEDEDGNFRIESMDLQKAKQHPYIHAIQTPNRFMVKVGQNGRLFNPYGLYSEGMETKQRVGTVSYTHLRAHET